MQDLGGRKLGNYELRERLGRGGMAEVYKAYQAGMDRFVAVKVMLGHLASDDSFVERFKREAQAVGKLRHPHIVQIFDFGIEGDIYFMAMEYITGGTLKEYLNEHQRLSPTDTLHVMRQLADGLDYAHKAGMIHRDLKPANVMIINEATKEVVLTDFGIAKIVGAAGLTGTGMAVGTPAYMSPESGRGEETDERADIYALGVMMYEMLIGSAPYDADTPIAVIMKHINAPLPTRKDYGELIPEAIERVILKSLAKDPKDRYQTAAAMRAAIDTAIQDYKHEANTKPVDVPRNRAVDDDKPTMMASPDNATETIANSSTRQSTTSPNILIAAVAVLIIIGLILGALYVSSQNPQPTEVAQVTENTDSTEAATDNPTAVPDEPTNETVSTQTSQISGENPLFLGGKAPAHPENLSLLTGISSIMDEVDTMLLAGQWDEALAYLDGLLEADPDNFSALFARSQYYSLRWNDEQNDNADANHLIELAPESEWGYLALTDAWLNYPEQDTEEARLAIEQAYALAPENPHVLWRYGALGDYEMQDERYYAAEDLGANGYRFVAWFGEHLFESRDYERALPYKETIMRYGIPDSYDREVAFWGVISSLILLDRAPEGYSIFTESGILNDTTDAYLYADGAYIAYRAGETEQAREWANTARALSSDTPQATYVLALIMGYADGDVDGAVTQLASLETVDVYSRFINWDFQQDINLDRARILDNAERYEEALPYYNAVVDYYSYTDWLYEERADLHLQLGDVNAARADLQQAFEITEDAAYRRELLARITELGPAPTSTPQAEATEEAEND